MGMEAQRAKPRHSRDVKASEGTAERRAAAESGEPGPRGKTRGCLEGVPRRAGRGQEDGEKGRSHHPPNRPGRNLGSSLNPPAPTCPISSPSIKADNPPPRCHANAAISSIPRDSSWLQGIIDSLALFSR